jgi:hypothetical protein
MTDEYLWNKSGESDPTVDDLERRLAPLRYRRRSFEAPSVAPLTTSAPKPRWLARAVGRGRLLRPRLAIAAAFVLVAGGAAWLLREPRDLPETSLEVKALEGTPHIGWRSVKEKGLLGRGKLLETDDSSRANIALKRVNGNVEVAKNSRVRLIEVGENRQELDLERGEINALVFAPPRLFLVKTPSATAVDLGCSYKLRVDDKGDSLLHVNFGWVALERKDGKSSDVPGGAECRSRIPIGPGTPYFEDAPPRLVEELAKYDFEGEQAPHLRAVLSEARTRDSLTVWHLLKRVGNAERHEVYAKLSALVPPPVGTDESNALEPARLEAWKEAANKGWYK